MPAAVATRPPARRTGRGALAGPPLLDDYDARARPLAIEYAPFRLTSPAESIVDLRFVATPGMRRAPQPARVVMNARFALAAGTYRVALTPRAGASLSGEWGVQVGRLGGPMVTWPVSAAPGAEWATSFTLDLDAGFVGFRASPDLEDDARSDRSAAAEGRRFGRAAGERGAVLAATRCGDVPVYFHDDRAYIEAGGFWTRREPRDAQRGAARDGRLGAAAPSSAALAGPCRCVSKLPRGPRASSSTAMPRPRCRSRRERASAWCRWRLPPRPAFVPAEHGGPPGDRRALGCWVEVGH